MLSVAWWGGELLGHFLTQVFAISWILEFCSGMLFPLKPRVARRERALPPFTWLHESTSNLPGNSLLGWSFLRQISCKL